MEKGRSHMLTGRTRDDERGMQEEEKEPTAAQESLIIFTFTSAELPLSPALPIPFFLSFPSTHLFPPPFTLPLLCFIPTPLLSLPPFPPPLHPFHSSFAASSPLLSLPFCLFRSPVSSFLLPLSPYHLHSFLTLLSFLLLLLPMPFLSFLLPSSPLSFFYIFSHRLSSSPLPCPYFLFSPYFLSSSALSLLPLFSGALLSFFPLHLLSPSPHS